MSKIGISTNTSKGLTALDIQIGGDWYKTLAIQPHEFAMANHYDSCAANVVKYVTRHRAKNGRQDIEKALHYVALRQHLTSGASLVEQMVIYLRGETFWGRWRKSNGHTIAMVTYVQANGIYGYEMDALLALETWLDHGQREDREALETALQKILNLYDVESEQ